MYVKDICTKKVVVTSHEEPLSRAAHLMREAGVGNIVVIEGGGENRVPVGALTDRDLVVEVISKDRKLDDLTVGDVMTPEIITIRDDMDIVDCLDKMQRDRIRRAPVVDANGHLVGIVSIDDLVLVVSKEVASLAKVLSKH